MVVMTVVICGGGVPALVSVVTGWLVWMLVVGEVSGAVVTMGVNPWPIGDVPSVPPLSAWLIVGVNPIAFCTVVGGFTVPFTVMDVD